MALITAGLIGSALSGVVSIVKGWSERKRVRLESDVKIAEAATNAKIERIRTAQEGDIKWENTALTNAGIKDEIMMFVILTPMIMCFIPGGAEIVRTGFNAMRESLPDYWEYAFYATIGVSYGIKKITDFMQIKKGA